MTGHCLGYYRLPQGVWCSIRSWRPVVRRWPPQLLFSLGRLSRSLLVEMVRWGFELVCDRLHCVPPFIKRFGTGYALLFLWGQLPLILVLQGQLTQLVKPIH